MSRRANALLCLVLLAGCSGPSEGERENRKTFEFLLTAVSMKNAKELEKDAGRIEERHTSGKLSDARYRDLMEIVSKARSGDWGEAERLAYVFREAQPFFK